MKDEGFVKAVSELVKVDIPPEQYKQVLKILVELNDYLEKKIKRKPKS